MTTTNKGLIQPANGSYVDTWDQPVNNDWSYIDAAFGGVTSLNATGVSSVTLTLTQYQPMAIAISGAMSNNVTYTIPSGVGGNWIVRNTTTDATGGPWTVTFASGGGGSTVTVIRSVNSNIWSDGTNMYFSDSRPAAAAGSNTQVQYNSSGFLGGANVYYNTQGNLGVGATPTTDTTYKWLEVIGANSTTGGAVQVRTSGSEVSGAFFNNNLAVYTGSNTAHPYILRTNSVEAMRIDTSGNVGIGTTSTSGTKLNTSVSTVSNAITATLATGAHDCSAYIATTASGVYNFDFFGGYNSSGVQYRVDGAGNVFTYGGTINTAGGSITSGAITSSGLVHSTSSGFQFPDGTIQTTAATGYTPPTSFSAVGTYAFLYYNGGIVGSGSTVTSNGANLFPCDTNIANVSAIGSGQVWQCMGYMGGAAATLWLRTS